MKGKKMEEKYSWKRTDEIEIDLADLLKRLCGQWKQIAACAAVFAVILGGYGILKDKNSMEMNEQETAALAQAEGIELTEAEEQAVADAVLLEKEIRGLETYLEHSVLMNLDPYHKKKAVMVYCISHVKRQEVAAVTESYMNFILNGGAADALKKSGSWKKDKSYLAELLSAYTKTYSYPYQAAADSDLMLESVFYIEITGTDDAFLTEITAALQDVLDGYSKKAVKKAGSHRLTLISSTQSTLADSGLQSQQHEKKAQLSSNRANLRAMTDAFHVEQLAVYRKAAGLENVQEEESGEAGSGSGTGRGIRYLIAGLAGGIFLYCGIYACWYLFSDTLKSMEDMRRRYIFPVYGGILPQSSERKKTGFLSRAGHEDCERGINRVLNRIRIACRKRGINKLYAVSDFAFSPQEKECLESMAGQLVKWGIEMKVSENALADTEVWDDLSEAGNLLMICRIGTTTYRIIDDAMGFYLENGIAVTGAAVFLRNK